MSKYSLEYTLFSSKEAPSAGEFSELVVRMCMLGVPESNDGPGPDSVIASLVDILHSFRAAEAEYDDDEAKIPVVENPENFLLEEARRLVGDPKAFNPWDDDIWADFWPTKCKWHPHELKKLARLAVGERDQWDNEVKRTMA
jgi:hypothetical protein